MAEPARKIRPGVRCSTCGHYRTDTGPCPGCVAEPAETPDPLSEEELADGYERLRAAGVLPAEYGEWRMHQDRLIDWLSDHADVLLDAADRVRRLEERGRQMEEALREARPYVADWRISVGRMDAVNVIDAVLPPSETEPAEEENG